MSYFRQVAQDLLYAQSHRQCWTRASWRPVFFMWEGSPPPPKLATPPPQILSRLYDDNGLQQSAPQMYPTPPPKKKSENLQEALWPYQGLCSWYEVRVTAKYQDWMRRLIWMKGWWFLYHMDDVLGWYYHESSVYLPGPGHRVTRAAMCGQQGAFPMIKCITSIHVILILVIIIPMLCSSGRVIMGE